MLIALAVVLAALMSSTGVVLATGTASAQQHPIGGSGIQGDITFTDSGSTLTVDGTATGLQAGTVYFSLIYANGTQPGGVSESKTGIPPTSDATPACNDLDKNGNSNITPTQMAVGFWTPLGSPNATLHVVKTHSGNSQEGLWRALGLTTTFENFGVKFGGDSYASIGTFQTVSIRQAPNFNLVACGQVH